MKKQLQLSSLFILLITLSINSFSQVPQGMNYQAIARNTSGAILANQSIGLRFTITDGNAGPVLYQETQSTTTNQFGLFTRNIGNGTPVTGTFAAVDWAGTTPWLEVEMDPTGSSSYVSMGSSRLLSVPYSQLSENSNNISGTTNFVSKFTGTHTAGNSLLFDNGTSIGLGTTTPASLFHLHQLTSPTLQFTNSSTGTTFTDGGAIYQTGSDFFIDNGENGNLIFNNNSAQRMRIASNGNVGINTTSPSAKLDLNGTFKLTDGTEGAGKVLTSDATGNAAWTNAANPKIGFRATTSNAGTISSGQTYIVYSAEEYDDGASYNSATGAYTVPSTGVYLLSASMELGPFSPYTSGYVSFGFDINGGSHYDIIEQTPNTIGSWSLQRNTTMLLNSGDIVKVRVYHNLAGGTLSSTGNSYYSSFTATKIY